MKQKWRQNLSHYEEFARMAAAANYHQNHVSRQLKHNYNNDGLEDDADREDDGDAASELRSSEESVEGSSRGFARGAIISYIRTLRGS